MAVSARLRATSFVNLSTIPHKLLLTITAPASELQNDHTLVSEPANAVFTNNMDTDDLKLRKRKSKEPDSDDDVMVTGETSRDKRARRSRRIAARVESYEEPGEDTDCWDDEYADGASDGFDDTPHSKTECYIEEDTSSEGSYESEVNE